MADILFIHNNFPGQFGRLAQALARQGHRCVAIASSKAGSASNVSIVKYEEPEPASHGGFEPALAVETQLRRAYEVVGKAEALRRQGFAPKVIVGHPAWGEMLFLNQVFPRARQVVHGEYYPPRDGDRDIAFDAEMGPFTLRQCVATQTHKLGIAMSYLEADRIVCPTAYQASLIPAALQDHISIVHEGIDTALLRPDSAAEHRLANGRVLSRETPLITYVSRKLEPLRGFHVFLRALPRVLAALPTAEVLIVGEEGHGYGVRKPEGSWKAQYLAEVGDRLDLARVHFTGKLPRDQLTVALQASSAHVYYTYPFVLSWSLLEAMACGGLVVASDTAPLRDVIEPDMNGLLRDFFDVEGLADTLIAACTRPADFEPLRRAARQTVVERFDLKTVCLPAWLRVVDDLLALGDRP